VVSATFFPPPQALRGNPQGPIKLTRRILPGDNRRKLDQRVVVEEPPHPREQLIAHIPVREGDDIGVLECNPLLLIVERARGVLIQGQYLLFGNSLFAADGSVYVLSENAPV
jgi:hypothetical protein